MLDYMFDYVHVSLWMSIYIDVVIRLCIENEEIWIKLLGYLIVLFEVIFETVMWKGSLGYIYVCVPWLCMCILRALMLILVRWYINMNVIAPELIVKFWCISINVITQGTSVRI